MTTKEQQEIDNLHAENARLKDACTRQAHEIIARTEETARLREALENLNRALGDQYDSGTYRHDRATDAAWYAVRAALAKGVE